MELLNIYEKKDIQKDIFCETFSHFFLCFCAECR